MPYVEKYEKILIEKHIIYDLVCFDRDSNGPLTHDGNQYTFHKKMGVAKTKKIIPYFSYIKYVKKLVKLNKYDKLIVLTTVPAVLLHNLLKRKYKNNYIFDFRDYSYENIKLYKLIVDKVVNTSYCTLISSKGFMHYLRKSDKIFFTHNISNTQFKECISADIDKQHINIGFVGYVRYYDVNTMLIEQLANKPNYRLQYYGTMYEDCDLKTFIKKNAIYNVDCFETYQNNEKPKIYKNITFINSIYSVRSKEVVYAIPNRLYDAALYKKPIIVAKNTYLGKVVDKYNLGFAIDLEHENIHDCINDFLKIYNVETFNRSCEQFLLTVHMEEDISNKKIYDFITE